MSTENKQPARAELLPIELLTTPFVRFAKLEAAGGILLLAIVYLRSILSRCAIEDPETTAVLSCWAYEEFFHGRTIGQFLAACGIPFSSNRVTEVKKGTSWKEWAKNTAASLIC
jgi:hypothetical protein